MNYQQVQTAYFNQLNFLDPVSSTIPDLLLKFRENNLGILYDDEIKDMYEKIKDPNGRWFVIHLMKITEKIPILLGQKILAESLNNFSSSLNFNVANTLIRLLGINLLETKLQKRLDSNSTFCMNKAMILNQMAVIDNNINYYWENNTFKVNAINFYYWNKERYSYKMIITGIEKYIDLNKFEKNITNRNKLIFNQIIAGNARNNLRHLYKNIFHSDFNSKDESLMKKFHKAKYILEYDN